MDTAKKVLKKVRRSYNPNPPAPASALDIYIAELRGKKQIRLMWERDKEIKRDANFQKMLVGHEVYRESVERERERQDEIAQERLRNLAKARRELKKRRNEK